MNEKIEKVEKKTESVSLDTLGAGIFDAAVAADVVAEREAKERRIKHQRAVALAKRVKASRYRSRLRKMTNKRLRAAKKTVRVSKAQSNQRASSRGKQFAGDGMTNIAIRRLAENS